MKFKPGQGKTQKQYEASAQAAFYGWCGVIIMIAILALFTLFSGCTTTKKVDKCCSKKESIK
tara:strand:- start:523 stop:708 length:186 start_codon:yes stop_codon:yes gene_type:complete